LRVIISCHPEFQPSHGLLPESSHRHSVIVRDKKASRKESKDAIMCRFEIRFGVKL
jgi:hypothetical protein